jgi:1A family penicillin-binding protein
MMRRILLPLLLGLWAIMKIGQLISDTTKLAKQLLARLYRERLLRINSKNWKSFQSKILTFKITDNLKGAHHPNEKEILQFKGALSLISNLKHSFKKTASIKNLLQSVQEFLVFVGILGFALYHVVKNYFSSVKFPTFNNNRSFSSAPKKPGKKKRRVHTPLFRIPLKIALPVLGILLAFYSYSLVYIATQLPTPATLSDFQGPMTTEVFDRNGRLLYRFFEGKNRSVINLSELPPHLINATIAIEDKNFYKHPGVDPTAILRAAVTYIISREVQGGSTITQQLIKNTMLTPDRTIERKLKEVVLAFWAERIFSKDQILQMYFNQVPYGGPTWGIAAASRTYFQKEVKDLTLAESTYLAGLPASPTTFSPYGNHPEFAKMRQREVLRRMVEDGYITKDQEQQALSEKISIMPPKDPIKAPHFVMYVREVLAQKYGERFVNQGGLKVYTSLDLDLQEKTEKIVAEEIDKLAQLRVTNGAAMVTDPKNGQILAMVGSKNYFDDNGGNFNVTMSLRQPGSSIKPITYAAAFKEGYTPGTVLLDTPISFKNEWEVYTPQNYDGKFHGAVSIRTALGSSYNIPAVKTLALLGLPKFLQTSKDLGITTFNKPENYGLSLTLGGAEVKMIDMMSVYGSFSQLGLRYEPQPILKVYNNVGKLYEDNTYPQGGRVLDAGIAYLISNILQDNKARTPAFGPQSLLFFPNHQVAVKTGTTDSKRDNWTFGFTPSIVVGVWVGNNDNTPMDPALTSGITGAAPIWNKIMALVLSNQPDQAFQKPSNVTNAMVDGNRDFIIKGLPVKSVIGVAHKPNPSPTDSKQKETITYTDPFSTYDLPKNP